MFPMMFQQQSGDNKSTESQMASLLSLQAMQVEQLLLDFKRWAINKPYPIYFKTEEHLVTAYEELMAALRSFVSLPQEVKHETTTVSTQETDEDGEGTKTTGSSVTFRPIDPNRP